MAAEATAPWRRLEPNRAGRRGKVKGRAPRQASGLSAAQPLKFLSQSESSGPPASGPRAAFCLRRGQRRRVGQHCHGVGLASSRQLCGGIGERKLAHKES